MGPMPWESRFHWLKLFAVSDINLNKNKKIIEVQIDIPVFHHHAPEIEEWHKLSASLAETIKSELEDETNEVNKVIVYYEGFPLFWSVSCSIQFIPGYQEERTSDLWEVLNNSDIINSPNAGRVINAVLRMLIRIGGGANAVGNVSHKDIKDKLQSFNNEVLGGFMAKRPCHVALGNISEILRRELEKGITSEKDRKRVIGKFQGIYDRYQKIRFDVAPSEELRTLINTSNGFLLYGYSSSVASLVSTLREDKKGAEIVIAECRSKTRYSFENKPLYSDGAQYAQLMKNRGFSNIRIIPDTEVATVLDINRRSNESRRYAILLGANGISQSDGSCGHSGGHLNITIVGRHFEVPIIVIADTLKIGELKPKPKLKRGEEWFTTYQPMVAELKGRGISFTATREDIIPGEMIDYLVTEEGSIPLSSRLTTEEGKKEVKSYLSKWANEWEKLDDKGK
jgi:translation initiation factor 2B subunit (eIF-2B alpha/beta/delta family)